MALGEGVSPLDHGLGGADHPGPDRPRGGGAWNPPKRQCCGAKILSNFDQKLLKNCPKWAFWLMFGELMSVRRIFSTLHFVLGKE